jgi:hypothetical protein
VVPPCRFFAHASTCPPPQRNPRALAHWPFIMNPQEPASATGAAPSRLHRPSIALSSDSAIEADQPAGVRAIVLRTRQHSVVQPEQVEMFLVVRVSGCSPPSTATPIRLQRLTTGWSCPPRSPHAANATKCELRGQRGTEHMPEWFNLVPHPPRWACCGYACSCRTRGRFSGALQHE